MKQQNCGNDDGRFHGAIIQQQGALSPCRNTGRRSTPLTAFIEAALANPPHHRSRIGTSERRFVDVPGHARAGSLSVAWPASGEMRMTAMDIVGLALLVFLIAPMVTARPSRY